MIKVLIADDQKTVQEILRGYIESDTGLELVGCAMDGEEALKMVEIYQPDVILMDIEMPILDGLAATKIIADKYIKTNVLIISVHNEDTYLETALQAGAKGYLKKNTPEKELVNAIYSSYKGYFQLGPGLLEKYLFKEIQSKPNNEEIEQLKEVVFEQSKLLDNINSNRESFSRSNRAKGRDQNKINLALESRCANLERQVFHISSLLEQLTKKSYFTQQISVLAVVSCALLGIALILSAMS